MFRKIAIICLGTLMVVAMVSMVHAPPAYATDRTWSNAGSGGWSVPANWGGTEPLSSDDANISNGGTAQITTSGEVASNLYLGYTYGNIGTIEMSDGGTLTTTNDEYIGRQNKGTFNQSGGTNATRVMYIASRSGSSGTYTQSGGVVSIGTEIRMATGDSTSKALYQLSGSGLLNAAGKTEYIGFNGFGTFVQSGGTNLVSNLDLGYSAGSSGLYTHSAGTVSIGNSLYVGYASGTTGSYSLSGTGLLDASAASEYIGNYTVGTFNQSGGTNNANSISVGSNTGASGTYTQSAGVVSIGSQLSIATTNGNTGLYELSGTGLLNATDKTEYVGFNGNGTFIQSGGTNNVGSLSVARWAGSSGTYTQSAGVVSLGTSLYIGEFSGATGSYKLSNTGLLNATGKNEYIGESGKGTFEQTGGTNFGKWVYVGHSNNSSGTYIQSGGVLSIGSGGYLVIGNSGFGSYALSGQGILDASATNVGMDIGSSNAGRGTLTQTGGSVLAYNLNIGMSGGSSGTYTHSAGVLSIANQLKVGGTPSATGLFELSGNGVIQGIGKTEYIGYAGKGTFTQSGGTNIVGTLYLARDAGSSGTYNLNDGYLSISTLTKGSGSSAFNMNGGTLKIPTLSAGMINFNGGKLSVGTFTGALDVPNGGIIAPGNSPGTQTQNGDITFNSGSALQIEIGGTGQGTTYDWLDVNGGNVLFNSGSKIQLSWWNSYLAPLGTSFDIITWDNGYTFTDNGFTLEMPSLAQFTYNIDNVNHKLTVTYSSAVPEPATIFTILGGLLMAGYRRVFKRKK
jgi:fibronectin-binding autotransporter adhesin